VPDIGLRSRNLEPNNRGALANCGKNCRPLIRVAGHVSTAYSPPRVTSSAAGNSRRIFHSEDPSSLITPCPFAGRGARESTPASAWS
jgi:hypothetical protein